MNAWQHGLGGCELMIAILAALVLAACTTRNQGQISSETRPPKQLAQQNARDNSLRPAAAHSPSKLSTARHNPAFSRSENAASHNEDAPNGSTAAVLFQIHQADLTEIVLGKLGEEKASAPEVRAYAEQLVQDHTSVDRTVAAMAQKNATQLRGQSTSPRPGHNGLQTAWQFEQGLKSASGSTFDKLFLRQAGYDHQRLIQKLQQDREDANDAELEALIDKIVPILEQHRELAQILMKKEQA
jgi:putative membrane protein